MVLSIDEPEDTFARFGRVVGRTAAADAQQEQDVKAPWIHEAGQSSTSTTWRDLSDRTQLTPSRFSPGEATAICQGALAEMSVDTVMVVVIKNTQGVIVGRLQWEADEPPHQVIFTLLQIKPRYTIVCDVLQGPGFFGRVCWKLRSISGCIDAEPAAIGKGDVLVLEGPRWATQRMLLQGGPKAEHQGSPVSASVASSHKTDLSVIDLDVDLGPKAGPHPPVRSAASSADVCEWERDSGPQTMHKDVRSKTPATRLPPAVPRLSLSKIHEPKPQGNHCGDVAQCRLAPMDAVFCKDNAAGAGVQQCSVM